MLRLTSRPNRLMVRYVHIVTLEKGPSEWTKAERPGGTKLSLPVSSLQPVCVLMLQTWLPMK